MDGDITKDEMYQFLNLLLNKKKGLDSIINKENQSLTNDYEAPPVPKDKLNNKFETEKNVLKFMM